MFPLTFSKLFLLSDVHALLLVVARSLTSAATARRRARAARRRAAARRARVGNCGRPEATSRSHDLGAGLAARGRGARRRASWGRRNARRG